VLAPALAVADAPDHAVELDQADDLGLADQPKGGVAHCLVGDEVEEVPLRDEGEVGEARRQTAEVDADRHAVGGLHRRARHPGVRQPQEAVGPADLVQDLERRWVDGVAAEVAQEVGVLLKHHHLDAGPGQQQPEHGPGRPAARDAAARLAGPPFRLRRRLRRGQDHRVTSLRATTPELSLSWRAAPLSRRRSSPFEPPPGGRWDRAARTGRRSMDAWASFAPVQRFRTR